MSANTANPVRIVHQFNPRGLEKLLNQESSDLGLVSHHYLYGRVYQVSVREPYADIGGAAIMEPRAIQYLSITSMGVEESKGLAGQVVRRQKSGYCGSAASCCATCWRSGELERARPGDQSEHLRHLLHSFARARHEKRVTPEGLEDPQVFGLDFPDVLGLGWRRQLNEMVRPGRHLPHFQSDLGGQGWPYTPATNSTDL